MHAIAVHGGAGTLSRAQLTPDNDRAYRAGLERALRAGFAVLAAGGVQSVPPVLKHVKLEAGMIFP